MKAMILAAGRGARMRHHTDETPKPLLCVKGKPLIEYHLEALAACGVKDILINISYLGWKIRDALGDGSRWGLRIIYSEEPERLETGGAIKQVLHLLGEEPFILINADVFTDLDLAALISRGLAQEEEGCLVLVPNPSFKPLGDFSCDARGGLRERSNSTEDVNYTFSGVSVLRPSLVANFVTDSKVFPLVEVFLGALSRKTLFATVHAGLWSDVGTPERLDALK